MSRELLRTCYDIRKALVADERQTDVSLASKARVLAELCDARSETMGANVVNTHDVIMRAVDLVNHEADGRTLQVELHRMLTDMAVSFGITIFGQGGGRKTDDGIVLPFTTGEATSGLRGISNVAEPAAA